MSSVTITLSGTKSPEVGFAVSAPIYSQNGFMPVPLSGKTLLVANATGRNGEITPDKISSWIREFPWANTGIRAQGWISIDVDHHDKKFGNDQLMELVKKYGPLPPTYYSSARGVDSLSRQLFFRVKTDVPMLSDPTEDIEIIHRYHRYSAVSPSIHPDLGTPYVWYTPTGEEVMVPNIEELPYLPQEWLNGLSRNLDFATDFAGVFAGEVNEWVEWLGSDEPTIFTQELIATISKMQHIGHSDLITLIKEINELRGQLWERGVGVAFDVLKSKYFATTNEKHPDKELENAIRWVITSDWEPSPIGATSMREVAMNIQNQAVNNSDESFWSSRPSLAAIYKLGRHKVVSPFSLLGFAIQRALHTVPYTVHYETFRGLCPLNTLMAFVGPTGTGKTLTLNVVNRGITFSDSPRESGGDGTWKGITEPGSGEAIPDSYFHLVKDEETQKQKKEWVHPNHAAMFGFDEIGMLEGRHAREGSTLLETMKQGWSGSVLGRKLASGKGTLLDPETYRFGLFINVQPARAEMLVTDSAVAGGLPSRFLFFSTQDANAFTEWVEDEPDVYKLPRVNWTGVESIVALPAMNEAHRAEAFAAIDGGIDAMDSHLLLTRAKVAIALAVLDGRSVLVEEDWELSQKVIDHSKATRTYMLLTIGGEKGKALAKMAKAAGTKTFLSEEAKANHLVNATARIIQKAFEEGKTKGIRRTLREDKRPYYDEAIELLRSRGVEIPSTLKVPKTE